MPQRKRSLLGWLLLVVTRFWQRRGLDKLARVILELLKYSGAFAVCHISYYLGFVAKKPKLHCKPTERNQFILSHCPSLQKSYFPSLFCYNAYLQMLAYEAASRISKLSRPLGGTSMYINEKVVMEDGGEVSLDWMLPDPLVTPVNIVGILLHTLTSDSEDWNMVDLSVRFTQKGMKSVVMNRRGHGGLCLRTPYFHCMGYSKDLLEIVQHVHTKYPGDSIAIIGYSAGSALSGRFLGDLGRDKYDLPVLCGVSISPSYDIHVGTKRIDNGYAGFYLLNNMKRLWLEPNAELLKNHNPRAYRALVNSHSVEEFLQLSVAFSQFCDFEEYMRHCNPMETAQHVELPLLCVNAMDDPITVNQNVEEIALPFLDKIPGSPILVRPRYGSHIAFLDFKHSSWVNNLVVEFITSVHLWNTHQNKDKP